MSDNPEGSTRSLAPSEPTVLLPRFRVRIVEGVDQGAHAISRSERLVVATHEGADLRLTDQLVMQQVNKAVAEKGMPPPTSGELEATGITQREPVDAKPQEILTTGDEFQEKDIVRILVVGGSEWLDEAEQVSVAQYIVNNI